MSAFGRGGEELARELRNIVEELRSFGGGLKDATNALPGVGFAANTAAKSLRDFSRDVGFGVAEDTFRFGSQYAGTAFESNALRAAAAFPTDPLGAARVQQPVEQAFNRLSGITSNIARAGGHVDTETRKQLADLLYDQERRAYWDNYENQDLQGRFTQRKIDRSRIFDDVPGYDLLKRIFGVSVR